MAKKIGLPDFVKTKHDLHLVEEIASRTKAPVVRNVAVDKLIPAESQPRKDFRELDELAESIRQKGLLQPILVRARNGSFEIIAGERRYRAACQIGLKEIPCIEYEVPENEALELSLVENIQRQELNAFEEAFALQTLADVYGYTHQEIAEKVGKSRVTVTELIRITDLPEEIVKRCLEMSINSKSFLLQLVKLPDIQAMNSILDAYGTERISRDQVKKERTAVQEKMPEKKKSWRLDFSDDNKAIQIKLHIRNKDINKEQLIETLEKLLDDIRQNRLQDLPF